MILSKRMRDALGSIEEMKAQGENIMPRICKHCHRDIYKEETGIWLHSSNFMAKCNVNFINLPVAEPEEELMPKEKSNEYIFKVEKWSQIEERRIAKEKENLNKEMILVIPDSANDRIIVMVDNQFNAKSQIISEHYWHVDGFICCYDNKANIQKYIDAYNKAKAEKPKPKQTVRVKTFGDTETVKRSVCANCHQLIHKMGGKWYHDGVVGKCLDAKHDEIPF